MLTSNPTLSAALPPDEAPAAGAATPSPAVLDAQALARLRELDPKGENKLLERVLVAFQTSVARLVPQLHDASRIGDRAGVRHVAHTLKSSSASIGALRLSQMCAEIETMIRIDKIENLDARVVAMATEVENVLQALIRVMDDKA
jgi:HPt (histidine-containing phosphotransfer) domain-containing protein